jgi:hypothetical protein
MRKSTCMARLSTKLHRSHAHDIRRSPRPHTTRLPRRARFHASRPSRHRTRSPDMRAGTIARLVRAALEVADPADARRGARAERRGPMAEGAPHSGRPRVVSGWAGGWRAEVRCRMVRGRTPRCAAAAALAPRAPVVVPRGLCVAAERVERVVQAGACRTSAGAAGRARRAGLVRRVHGARHALPATHRSVQGTVLGRHMPPHECLPRGRHALGPPHDLVSARAVAPVRNVSSDEARATREHRPVG